MNVVGRLINKYPYYANNNKKGHLNNKEMQARDRKLTRRSMES